MIRGICFKFPCQKIYVDARSVRSTVQFLFLIYIFFFADFLTWHIGNTHPFFCVLSLIFLSFSSHLLSQKTKTKKQQRTHACLASNGSKNVNLKEKEMKVDAAEAMEGSVETTTEKKQHTVYTSLRVFFC